MKARTDKILHITWSGLLAVTFAGLTPAVWAQSKAPAVKASAQKDSEEKEKPQIAPEDLLRYQEAAKTLATSTGTKQLVRSMRILESEYPDTRSVLVEAAGSTSKRLRCFALKILGENGDPETDLVVVVPRLKDRFAQVRLAAVMAVQRLCMSDEAAIAKALPAMAAYLPGETEANNRKMAVKTLQRWKNRDAIPLLVKVLKTENDQGVRNFLFTALRKLSGVNHGRDVQAWEEYSWSYVSEKQREGMQDYLQSLKEQKERD